MILYWLIYIVGFAVQSKEKGQELMNRVQNGDAKALRQIYGSYKSILFGLIVSMLKDREEAEDCLQEVFTQLWEKADRFDASKGNLYSFIVTMARNKAIDRIRSRAYKDSKQEDHTISDFSLTPESDFNNPEEDLELSERANLVRSALKKLNSKEREVLKVAYYGGMSQTEISEKMEIPLGTVKYRMRQGMIKLKDFLKQDITE